MNNLESQIKMKSYVNTVKYGKLRKANTFSDTCISTSQPISLLPVSVEPDAKNHKDDPAGCPDSCDERWLLHNV